jgi:hypothetical protein
MSAQTDRELLELAAKAAGYDTSHRMNRERMELDPPVASLWVRNEKGLVHTGWNPLDSDADALRLAVKLWLVIDKNFINKLECEPTYPGDPCATTRRAIVRAAAAIGEAMP